MNQADLQRVEHDLATIQNAIGNEPTVSWDHFRECLIIAAMGAYLVLTTLSGFTSPTERLISMTIWVVAVAWSQRRMWQRFRDEQFTAPRRWRRHRIESRISGAVALLVVAFVFWMKFVVLPYVGADANAFKQLVAPPIFFLIGATMTIAGYLDSDKRWWITTGVAMFAISLLLPFCRSANDVYLALGSSILMGAVVSAAVLWRFLRRNG